MNTDKHTRDIELAAQVQINEARNQTGSANTTTEGWHIIHTYTRAEAIRDGCQVDVSTTAREAGITFPVFLTRAVFDAYVAVPPDVQAQDEAGRLWDVVWMTRFAILRTRPGVNRITVALYVRNDNQRSRLVKLTAVCGLTDIDDPAPAITVMLPDED